MTKTNYIILTVYLTEHNFQISHNLVQFFKRKITNSCRKLRYAGGTYSTEHFHGKRAEFSCSQAKRTSGSVHDEQKTLGFGRRDVEPIRFVRGIAHFSALKHSKVISLSASIDTSNRTWFNRFTATFIFHFSSNSSPKRRHRSFFHERRMTHR